MWLLLSVLLVYSDSDLLAPNLTKCAESLHMTALERDEKLGGGLSLGMFLVGAPAAFLIGVLADGCLAKTKLLSIVLGIGGTGCVLSGMAATYEQLFLARSLTGISLAGAFPLTYALVSEWYSPDERTLLFSRLDLVASIGVLVGQSVAGWIGPTVGWRLPFVIVGLPMILLSVLVYQVLYKREVTFTTSRNNQNNDDTDTSTDMNATISKDKQHNSNSKEGPQHRRQTNDDSPTISSTETAQSSFSIWQWAPLFRRPTYWLLLLQGIPGCVPWSVLCTFWPDYLHVNTGYSVEEATWIVFCFKIGVMVGIWGSGQLGRRLYAMSTKHPPIFMLVVGIARIPLTTQLLYPHRMQPQFLVHAIAFLAGILAAPTGTLVRAMVSHITEPTQRGMAFASFVLTDDIGRGAGPVLVAHWIALAHGERQPAFETAIAQGWIWNSVFAGLTYFTVRRDERDVKHAMQRLPSTSNTNDGRTE